MNPATALATALVEAFVEHGLTDACLAPGSRSAPLALALLAHPAIRLHVRIDERSAAFVGLGIGKTSRRPAVVVTTSGTAAANLYPAVVEAHESRVPLLVLTADRPPELRGTGANQTIDQIKLYGSCVRWFCEVGVPAPGVPAPGASGLGGLGLGAWALDASEARGSGLGAEPYWCSLAARAWAEAVGALGGSPGPVHLNVPFREPLLPQPEPGVCRVARRPVEPLDTPQVAPPPRRADVEWLAALVNRTERGLLVAGDCDVDPQPLLRVAETAAWPVLAEPTSNLRAGPNAVSTAHHLLGIPEFAEAYHPDAVLVVGKVGLSRPLLGLLGPVKAVPQVLLDPHGAWLDPVRATPRVVVGDLALTAAAVTEQITPRERSPWRDAWLDAEAKARHALDALLDAIHEPTEPRTARDLATFAADGALLVAASSMPIRDLNLAMRPRSGLRVIGNRGASGIDGFVSTAVGAALAHPGPTLALAGDLSLLHDQNGLLVAASEPRPDLTLVVVNNDGGGIFSLLPHARLPDGFERLFGTPHGVDFACVAEAAGCGYRRIKRAADLAAAVNEAANTRGIQLVEVRTDRAANAELHTHLQQAVSTALT